MRRLLLLLKILACVLALVAVLLGVAVYLLNNKTFQNKVLQRVTVLLSERLGTKVTADSVYINVFGQQVELYGVDVEDQQQRKMLQIKELGVSVNLMALRRDEVRITNVNLRGLRALLIKADADSTANYQFVLDSLKNKTPKAESDNSERQKQKRKLSFDVNRVTIDDISLQYNDNHFRMGHLRYRQGMGGRRQAEIQQLFTSWRSRTKKGELVDHSASLSTLYYNEKDGLRRLSVDSLHYKTDNHRPRKNKGRPKRGYFDAGHLDISATLEATVDHLGPDSLSAAISAKAFDTVTGIDLRNIFLTLRANKRVAHLSDVMVQQGWTILKFKKGRVNLPSKKEGRTLSYATSTIVGYVVLQDISRPFAPVLKNFVQPLHLLTRMSGDSDGMTFRHVKVYTPDKAVVIRAAGNISHLREARALAVNFDVSEMLARGKSKERIISQFPVKKLMMKQLHALGDIRYTGHFSVLWRKEVFSGLLRTQVGNINFNLTVDGNQKYIYGTASSEAIQVDKTFDLPNIGVANCQAEFKVDISKQRTAKMRQLKGGKLPIGTASIHVAEVRYKKIPVRNISIGINSDGAVAEGSLKTNGRHMDLSCNFSFTNTDEMKKMKITKPGIKFHKLSDEDKQKKAEEKLRKKQEKAEEKLRKKQEKAERKLQKEQEKAEEKLRKEQEKAEKKRRKEQEKAEKKLRKEQEKQARK